MKSDAVSGYDILEEDYRDSKSENDNVLIFYAGHRWLDEQADRGYWLPVDAAVAPASTGCRTPP